MNIQEHGADLSFIKSAVQSLSPLLKKGDLVILESTSPVGTTEKISVWLKEQRPDLVFASPENAQCDIYIAYCLERILPGQALRELRENGRVVGGLNQASTEKDRNFHRLFVTGSC